MDRREKANALRKAKFGNVVTASRNYFVPLIQYCRNNCLYCGFSRVRGKKLISKEEFLVHVQNARQAGCRELLLVLGDRPEEVSHVTREFLEQNQFGSSIEYVHWACETANNYGLEPHVNVGVIGASEWEYLSSVVSSAGLMLESASERLLAKKMAHQSSPDKNPQHRISSIKAALGAGIPFTSGLLVGIGETEAERLDTIQVLNDLAEEFQLLQEVIVQGFSPLPNTPWRDRPAATSELILETITDCRLMLPPDLSVQFPPNLVEFPIIEGIKAGANDLGGVSPVTVDFVNFTHPWPRWDTLMQNLKDNGLSLVERGPVYGRALKALNANQ